MGLSDAGKNIVIVKGKVVSESKSSSGSKSSFKTDAEILKETGGASIDSRTGYVLTEKGNIVTSGGKPVKADNTPAPTTTTTTSTNQVKSDAQRVAEQGGVGVDEQGRVIPPQEVANQSEMLKYQTTQYLNIRRQQEQQKDIEAYNRQVAEERKPEFFEEFQRKRGQAQYGVYDKEEGQTRLAGTYESLQVGRSIEQSRANPISEPTKTAQQILSQPDTKKVYFMSQGQKVQPVYVEKKPKQIQEEIIPTKKSMKEKFIETENKFFSSYTKSRNALEQEFAQRSKSFTERNLPSTALIGGGLFLSGVGASLYGFVRTVAPNPLKGSIQIVKDTFNPKTYVNLGKQFIRQPVSTSGEIFGSYLLFKGGSKIFSKTIGKIPETKSNVYNIPNLNKKLDAGYIKVKSNFIESVREAKLTTQEIIYGDRLTIPKPTKNFFYENRLQVSGIEQQTLYGTPTIQKPKPMSKLGLEYPDFGKGSLKQYIYEGLDTGQTQLVKQTAKAIDVKTGIKKPIKIDQGNIFSKELQGNRFLEFNPAKDRIINVYESPYGIEIPLTFTERVRINYPYREKVKPTKQTQLTEVTGDKISNKLFVDPTGLTSIIFELNKLSRKIPTRENIFKNIEKAFNSKLNVGNKFTDTLIIPAKGISVFFAPKTKQKLILIEEEEYIRGLKPISQTKITSLVSTKNLLRTEGISKLKTENLLKQENLLRTEGIIKLKTEKVLKQENLLRTEGISKLKTENLIKTDTLLKTESVSKLKTDTILKLKSKLTTRPTPKLKTQPFFRPQLRIKTPKIPLGALLSGNRRKNIISESLGAGYDVYIKRRGKVVMVGSGFTRRSALGFGTRITRTTEAVSFTIAPSGIKATKKGFENEFGTYRNQYYTKGGFFIEKSKFRIDTAGELNKITKKGIEAIRSGKKRRKLL